MKTLALLENKQLRNFFRFADKNINFSKEISLKYSDKFKMTNKISHRWVKK